MMRRISITILVVITVVIVIVASLPFITIPSGNKSKLTVTKVIDDQSFFQYAGDYGHTLYILNVSLTYGGSGTLNVNPNQFYVVTRNGQYVTDSFFSSLYGGENLLESVQLTSGQTTSGQVVVKIPTNVSVSGLKYEDAYGNAIVSTSAIPTNEAYVSYITGYSASSSNSDLSVFASSMLATSYASWQTISLNLSMQSFSGSAITVSSMSANNSFTVVSISPNLPFAVNAPQYFTVVVKMPQATSYCGDINLVIGTQ